MWDFQAGPHSDKRTYQDLGSAADYPLERKSLRSCVLMYLGFNLLFITI